MPFLIWTFTVLLFANDCITEKLNDPSIAGQFVPLDHSEVDVDPEDVHDTICPHIDPNEKLEEWESTAHECTADQLPLVNNDHEKDVNGHGYKRYAYNVLASNRIGPRRQIPDSRHQLCLEQHYNIPEDNNRCSVLIVYHNEALSVLIRMINSIIDRTPANLLHQIVLLDDCSDKDLIIQPHLEEYSTLVGWPSSKLTLQRSDVRLGLIRAKIAASKLANGDVIVFLDSHCEVNIDWIQPLIHQLQLNPKRVAIPIVDWIDSKTFEYTEATVGKGGFNWLLRFEWVYMPWEYYQQPDNHIKPLSSAAMSGGLLAIRKDWFHESGEYDPGMDIWGAENIEMSVRVWMCGGDVTVVPCSRVGHVFRYTRPYSNPNRTQSDRKNAVRAARVWLDDYQKKMFKYYPGIESIDAGDLTDRIKLRQKLKCHDFQWYIDNVYPELSDKTQ